MRSIISGIIFVLGAASCGDDCVVPPCPAPIALDLSVTSSAGASVPGLSVAVSGPTGSESCQPLGGACLVGGYHGTYQLTASAPGFQTVKQTVEVTSSGSNGCGTCEIPHTQHLSITLAPAASG